MVLLPRSTPQRGNGFVELVTLGYELCEDFGTCDPSNSFRLATWMSVTMIITESSSAANRPLLVAARTILPFLTSLGTESRLSGPEAPTESSLRPSQSAWFPRRDRPYRSR